MESGSVCVEITEEWYWCVALLLGFFNLTVPFSVGNGSLLVYVSTLVSFLFICSCKMCFPCALIIFAQKYKLTINQPGLLSNCIFCIFQLSLFVYCWEKYIYHKKCASLALMQHSLCLWSHSVSQINHLICFMSQVITKNNSEKFESA